MDPECILRIELIRFADGLDMGMRERGNKGDWIFWGPSSQKDRVVIRQMGKAGGGQGRQGCCLFHVGLVRGEVSVRPLSGDNELQVTCSLHMRHQE